MKSKNILAGCIAALTLATAAQAATYHVYLTGSSAFRSATQAGLTALYGAAQAQDNAAIGSANFALYKKLNYPLAGDTTYVKTFFNGSGAGVQAVAAGFSLPANTQISLVFYADTVVGTTTAPSTLPVASQDSHVPDIALSDVYQGTTPFIGTGTRNIGTIGAPVNVTTTYEDLSATHDNLVGVVTFKFVGSKNFPNNGGALFNMTPQLAQGLFANGRLGLNQFTGAAADSTVRVFASGRNPDSGTRATAFAESGVGVNSVVKQWKPTASAGAVTSQVLYPVELINGVTTTFAGNSGEASGSSLRSLMTNTIPAAVYTAPAQGGAATNTGAFYATYLGVSDANSVAANTTELKYNGVQFSELAVQQGQYTFWGYEHVMFRADSVGTTAETVANDLEAQLLATLLTPNVNLSDMKVSRGTDGGLVLP